MVKDWIMIFFFVSCSEVVVVEEVQSSFGVGMRFLPLKKDFSDMTTVPVHTSTSTRSFLDLEIEKQGELV